MDERERSDLTGRLRKAAEKMPYPYFLLRLEDIEAWLEAGYSVKSVWRIYSEKSVPFPGSYRSFLRYCNAHALGSRRAKEGTQSGLHGRGQPLPSQRPNETPSKRGPLRGPKPVGSVLGRSNLFPPPLDRPPGFTPEQINRMMDPDGDLGPNR
ncbi:MAG: TraK family protein [Polyangiales bacterium]